MYVDSLVHCVLIQILCAYCTYVYSSVVFSYCCNDRCLGGYSGSTCEIGELDSQTIGNDVHLLYLQTLCLFSVQMIGSVSDRTLVSMVADVLIQDPISMSASAPMASMAVLVNPVSYMHSHTH